MVRRQGRIVSSLSIQYLIYESNVLLTTLDAFLGRTDKKSYRIRRRHIMDFPISLSQSRALSNPFLKV